MNRLRIAAIWFAVVLCIASLSTQGQNAFWSLIASGRIERDPLCSRLAAFAASHAFLSSDKNVRSVMDRFTVSRSEDGLELVESHDSGWYWIPAGNLYDLANNLAEVESKAHAIRTGDIVIDCGAHLGTYTEAALRAGASRVIAIEPSPDNLRCLRRRFGREIDDGRVVLVEAGVWSEPGELMLTLAPVGSAGHTMVRPLVGSRGSVAVPVTTIDALVEKLNLGRVDIIKMDIEGAETHALAGAAEAIKRYRPRLYISGYHQPTDAAEIQQIVSSFSGGYSVHCGTCRLIDERILPETMEFLP